MSKNLFGCKKQNILPVAFTYRNSVFSLDKKTGPERYSYLTGRGSDSYISVLPCLPCDFKKHN